MFLNRTDTGEMPLIGVITVCQSTCCKASPTIISQVENDQTFSLCLYVALFGEHLEDYQPPFIITPERYFQHSLSIST